MNDLTSDGCATGPRTRLPSHGTQDGKALHSTDSGLDSGFMSENIDSRYSMGIVESSGDLNSGELSPRGQYSRTSSVTDSGINIQSTEDLSRSMSKLDMGSGCDQTPEQKRSVPEEKTLEDKVREQAFTQDQDGDTYLHVAIADGFVEAVFSLIRLALNPKYLDVRNNCWHTPLHIAVLTEQPLIVRRLVLAGASLCIRDKWGNTPLHYASDRGSVNCVLSLLTPIDDMELTIVRGRRYPQSTQCLDLKNYQGQTSAHLAARRGYYDVLKHLFSYGADMNSRDGLGGRTPLHYAVQTGNIPVADLLLSCCRVNAEIENYAGHTAYQQAYICDHPIKHDLARLGSQRKEVSLSSDESDLSEEEDMDAEMSYSDIKVSGAPVLTAVSG